MSFVCLFVCYDRNGCCYVWDYFFFCLTVVDRDWYRLLTVFFFASTVTASLMKLVVVGMFGSGDSLPRGYSRHVTVRQFVRPVIWLPHRVNDILMSARV